MSRVPVAAAKSTNNVTAKNKVLALYVGKDLPMIDKKASTPDQKVARVRNVWVRIVIYSLVSVFIGYVLYISLSNADLDYLVPITNKRSALVVTMLSIMSAKL